MAKEPFLRVVPLKGVTKATVRRIVTLYLAVCWIVPLITLVPVEKTGTSLTNWYLLIIMPVSLLGAGVIIGMNYGFYPILPIGCALAFFPTALVYGFTPAWQYCVFYAAIIGGGNILTEILKTSSKDYYKNKASM